MSYLKGVWKGDAVPEMTWGASYLAHKKYANLAYRLNYNHATQTAQHEAGFEGKCYDDKVYYKGHFTFEGAKQGEEGAPAPAHKMMFNLYNEHKCTANFTYKYKVQVDLNNPSAYKWGAVLSSST